MKKTKNVKLKSGKGITLIALVITIIVLLILAAVSIATLTGENGILTRANDAKEQTEITSEKEQVELAAAAALADARGGEIQQGVLEEELGKYFKAGNYEVEPGTNEDGTEGYVVTITENDENGRKYFVDKDGNVLDGEGEVTLPTTGKTDGSYDTAEGVNTPKLKDNMKLVVYNSGEWVEDTTKTAYKYEAQTGSTENGGTSEWANAELDGNYYVWIPRYAYKIDKNTEYTSQSGTSYKIDVKFLVGTTNKYYDENGNEKEAKIATNADEISAEGNTDYYVHPAFTFGETELEGLWIGKYESSDAGDNKIEIVPNATSLRIINVSTMFSRAQTLSTTNIDAHMLKNTEWGAVAYLTQSQYGRNGTEVSVNQCSNYVTGAGRGTGNNPIYNSTYYSSTITDDQRYNGNIGKLSSTTGNVYGIYDMSGGAYEYVMGVYGTSGSPTVGNSGFETFPESKYYNLYTAKNNSNIGDALYETSGWNSDYASFVRSRGPFFVRGGLYSDASDAGVFFFNGGGGGSSTSIGFRVCLAV